MADLETLVAVAREKGWALGSGDVESVRKQAALLGWVEVAPRRGDGTVSALRPATANSAHPKSLSAVYGLGQQPLHTDGAHMQEPPDFLVFISVWPSPTPTHLWPPDSPVQQRRAMSTTSALTHGMFLVRSGRDSFYASALSGSGYRYDPGCMTPCDARARQVREYFEQELPRAFVYEWQTADQLLVVSNCRALHARAAVTEGDLDRELTRIAFRAGPVR